MNIWHDVRPERIKPDNFLSVIEIKKGARRSTNLTKKRDLSFLTVFFIHQRIILQITDLFRGPMPMTAIRSMCLFSHPRA